jgi:hypothetical protein
MRHPAVWLSLALLALSAAFISYRVGWLKYPVLPTAPGHAWQLTIEARIKPEDKEITAMIALPSEHAGRMLMEERISSGTLNFSLIQEGSNRIGIWSGAAGPEEETITYHSTVLMRPQRTPRVQLPTLSTNVPPITKGEQALVSRLATRWSGLTPVERFRAVAGAAEGKWGAAVSLDDRDIEAWKAMERREGRLVSVLSLFRAAGLPAHPVEGFRHVEGIWQSPLTWIEVWSGQKWESVWPETGEIIQKPALLFPLSTGGVPAIRVTGGTPIDVRWSLSRQIVSKWNLHFERLKKSEHLLDIWSLFSLPQEFQETFRILLLVPIGALMICVLRNVIGFPTFGIFMPVLMALAFRSTGLAYGLGIFAGVVLVGYAVRRAIDRFHLLLVPRLSVILTLVILCLTALALIGSKAGMRAFMAVGLLPMVILTMTVERFFVVIEESGVMTAFQTAAGSAAVATITYLILQWEPLQLTFFIYPELLFAVAAAEVLLGRYTGYRVSEMIRFRNTRAPL